MARSNVYSNGSTHLSQQPSYKSKLKKKITSTLAGILKVVMQRAALNIGK